MIADAGSVVSSTRHEAQGLLNRAEQQIAHTQREAQNVVVQAQHQVNVAKQQAQSAVQQVHQQAQAEVAFAKQQVMQSESVIIELRQRNARLEQQQSEMMQQMAQLQSMVHQMQAARVQQTDTSHVHAQQIESPNGAGPNVTAVADAMKALATHAGETMNELRQVILASSPTTSPKAKAKGRKAEAQSAGIPATGQASGSASPPASFIPHAASPIAAPPAAPSHVLAKASAAKAALTKHKPAAPPLPPPGPDVYELAPRLEEEENYGDQGWFDDDPEVDIPEIDIDLFGDTQPRVASVGAGSFPVSSPKASSDVAHDDYESETCKYKDLKDPKLPGLPKDSVGYRSWRNAVLTQFGSIDRTGTARILKWLQACLQPEANTDTIIALQSDSNQLPRLDAYLASQISEARYMKGEFGLEIQSYIERAHARGITP